MPRREHRPAAPSHRLLEPQHRQCWVCGDPLWVAYHSHRTIATLEGLVALTLVVRTCRNPTCSRFKQPYRPEEEGHLVLPQGEFGLDVIALVGGLRFGQHRSVPEIHRELVDRTVAIAERTVTHLLHRYEELVALHLADQSRLQDRLREQGRVILALDGLQPDVGHEVLWVLRDVLSGEVLLARSRLSGTTDDLATLLQEVKDALSVPIAGVISDGAHPLRRSVQQVLPAVPQQLCQFHYLREAAKPVYEADRHAKKLLKKEVRGVRPIERRVEGREDEQAAVIRGYCLAVRSALTDDGRPPLAASGLQLHDRLHAIQASLERVADHGDLPIELTRLQHLLDRGLARTASLWPAIQTAYGWVHQAAHLLGQEHAGTIFERRQAYRALLAEMVRERAAQGLLGEVVSTFLKVTKSYWGGLFACYQTPELPRTNNDLEQFFGSARYHERRATGRKGACPAMVVRGSVRLVAAVATRLTPFGVRDLVPSDLAAWRTLRQQLDHRHAARRAQHRFRHDPERYLAQLEEQLLRSALPS